MTSQVDQYLDEMFDRLAGTGGAGRRMLAETEDHLLTAVAEGRSRGLDVATAEAAAVARFGAADVIAGQVPRPGIGQALRQVAVGAWTAIGLAFLWYGLSGLLTWLLAWPWVRLLIAQDRFGAVDMCNNPAFFPRDYGGSCVEYWHSTTARVAIGRPDTPFLILGGVGLIMLVALLVAYRATTRRSSAWQPSRRYFGVLVALPFGLGSAVMLPGAVGGIVSSVQDWALAYLVSGLTAAIFAVGAIQQARRA